MLMKFWKEVEEVEEEVEEKEKEKEMEKEKEEEEMEEMKEMDEMGFLCGFVVGRFERKRGKEREGRMWEWGWG